MTDASIQKRAPVYMHVKESSKYAKRSDDETGLCIYLSRNSVISHIAERVEKELENGKNSRYFRLLPSR